MSQFLSCYIGGIFLIASEIVFGKLILESNPKVSKWRLLIIILLFSFLYTINYKLFVGSLKTLISIIIHICLFKSLFNISISKSFLVTFLCILMLVIQETILLLSCINIFGFTKNFYVNNFAGLVYANIAISCLLLIFTILFRKLLIKIINIRLEINTKIIIMFVFTIFCLVLLFFSILKEFKVNSIIPYLISMCLLFFILVSLFREKCINNNLVTKYDQLLEFMKTYEEEVEKERILRHENKNQLIAIKSKIIDKEKESKIVSYIDEIIDEETFINKEQYAQFMYLPSNGIKGLFYYKAGQAENLNLHVSVNVSSNLDKTVIYNLDSKRFNQLGKVLGVYLDNAIEASSESEEKVMGIEIYSKHKDVEIIISNSYSRLGGIGNSTKGSNRGHGLLLVKNILSKNKWIEQETEITDKLYIQKLKIKKSI